MSKDTDNLLLYDIVQSTSDISANIELTNFVLTGTDYKGRCFNPSTLRKQKINITTKLVLKKRIAEKIVL